MSSQADHMLLWNIMNGKTKRKIPVQDSELVLSVLEDVRKVKNKEMDLKELRLFSDQGKETRHGKFWSHEEDEICRLVIDILEEQVGYAPKKEQISLYLPFRNSSQVHGHRSKRSQCDYHRENEFKDMFDHLSYVPKPREAKKPVNFSEMIEDEDSPKLKKEKKIKKEKKLPQVHKQASKYVKRGRPKKKKNEEEFEESDYDNEDRNRDQFEGEDENYESESQDENQNENEDGGGSEDGSGSESESDNLEESESQEEYSYLHQVRNKNNKQPYFFRMTLACLMEQMNAKK